MRQRRYAVRKREHTAAQKAAAAKRTSLSVLTWHLLVVAHRAAPRQVCGAVHKCGQRIVGGIQQVRLGVQEGARELLAHRLCR
jgi:hypothetical protein